MLAFGAAVSIVPATEQIQCKCGLMRDPSK